MKTTKKLFFLLCVCLFPLLDVSALNYKLHAGKTYGNAGFYKISKVFDGELKTDNPASSEFKVELETIFAQRFGLSFSRITTKTKYTMKYNAIEFFPAGEKTVHALGFKTYFNEQIHQDVGFNYYVGISYIIIETSLTISEPELQFGLKNSGDGTSLNLGMEILFNDAGLRLEVMSQEVSGSSDLNVVGNNVPSDSNVTYTLDETGFVLGVFLFI